jgi:hypothetical protein
MDYHFWLVRGAWFLFGFLTGIVGISLLVMAGRESRYEEMRDREEKRGSM